MRSNSNSEYYKITSHSDFLISYSTEGTFPLWLEVSIKSIDKKIELKDLPKLFQNVPQIIEFALITDLDFLLFISGPIVVEPAPTKELCVTKYSIHLSF